MDDFERFLAELADREIRLWVEEGERLKFRAPKGAMTAEVKGQLQAFKPQLLALFGAQQRAELEPTAVRETYPLSQAQWRLWVLMQMEGSTAAYNIPLHQLLEGEIDRELLAEALALLVARHESLRTTFVVVEGEPRQKVHKEVEVGLGLEDLSGLAEPEATARKRGQAEAIRPFDLEQGPLIRVALLKLGEARYVLLLTLHHIIADGMSIGVLARDLGELYASLGEGREARLPKLKIQYRDFVAWQNKLLSSGAIEPHQRYWQEKLGSELPVLNFPVDFPRPAVQTFKGAELGFRLDKWQTEGLLRLGREQGATLFMVLTAVVKTLLYHYTNQTDVIVGSPTSGRLNAELENQIGFYLNTLALRDQLDAEATFAENLRLVRQTITQAFDHQVYPFDFLVNELALQRDLSRSPLFDVMLILQNQAERDLALGKVRARPFFEHTGTSKVDLTFYFKEIGGAIQGAIEYNTDLFAAERIERLSGHLQTLVESVLGEGERPLWALNVIPEAEQQLLTETFQGEKAAGQCATILDLWAAQVAQTPEKTAVRFANKALTYMELDQQAEALAAELQAAYPVEPDTRVGLMMRRSEKMVVALLGILKAGGAYVPIDPDFPAARVDYILEHAECAVVVEEGGSGIRCQVSDEGDRRHATGELAAEIDADSLAYIMYTSGSTGKPKGVMVTHGNVASFNRNMQTRFGLRPDDIMLALTTITFDISVLELVNSLLSGLTVVVAPEAEIREPAQVWEMVRQQGVTALQVTPSRLKLLLEGRPVEVLKQLRVLLVGGEALPPALLEQLRPVLGEVEIINVYGPTEATIWSTCKNLGDGVLTIGRPLVSETAYILTEREQLAPLGVVGEICMGGTGVTKGYFKRPDLTAERFSEHREWGRLYKTGDLGYWLPNGEIVCLGRNDQQVKVRGYRIELAEIESVLVAHEKVQAAVVDAPTDEAGDKQLVAYLVGETLTLMEVRAFLRKALPEYMLPTAVVMLAQLPLTPNGKVDRKALPSVGETAGAERIHVLPRDEVEEQLVAIWEAVLERPEQVGVLDNFFDLGGHSLKAMRIVAAVQREMNVTLQLVDIFKEQTVANLAQVLHNSTMDKMDEIRPVLEGEMAMDADDEIAPLTDEELALLEDWD